ncbi:thaumatin, partial [Circinella umbellata]
VKVTVKNSCSNNLKVYKLTNGGGDQEDQDVSAGSSHDFQVSSDWSGRFWGCKDGGDCGSYGSAVSLAEFLFKGYEGSDFYDISFVDGFNLPMSIEPEGQSGGGGDGYNCGSPTCSSLPTCPDELKGDNGACKSACAAFGTEEYCCTGEYNSPDKCKASEYADQFKSGCSDAYSYAYDDAKSTFGCKADKYTVTFCP